MAAVEMNVSQLASVASTFANIGTNPISGTKNLEPHIVRDVVSQMFGCGMNQYTGDWSFKVGIPAKSGQNGSLMIVIPNGTRLV